ncbi:MAG TPA: hypothetical protein VFE78_39115 [Gemmataceae bacterium]|nr:hypothetical protein [Gemmataceae bacterium]
MGVTAIKRLENRSGATVRLLDVENTNVRGHGVSVGPGASLAVDMWVPWAPQVGDFPGHHLELQSNGRTRYWVWQAQRADGDYVRFCGDGAWHDPGARACGVAAVGRDVPPGDGDRTLVVLDDGFELVAFPDDLAGYVRSILAVSGYRICGGEECPAASVPKASAVAFSMAGHPSDAYGRGEPGARFLYRDSGKRYQFELRNGVAVATGPDGKEVALTQAVSFTHRRAGEAVAAPPFDLIAANGGRVFAKEQGQGRFYFAAMDHTFIQAGEDGREFPVPSTYFKLDPEVNQPGARTQDLTAPLAGCFADHPAAVRFPLFRLVLGLGLVDFMVVGVRPRTWHLIDVRPPLARLEPELLAIDLARRWYSSLPALQVVLPFLDQFKQQVELSKAQEVAPPQGVPPYPHVVYCLGNQSVPVMAIDFTKVLDVGVGHVHWHEQYERVTGGELQPLRAGPVLQTPFGAVDYAFLYRIANGPVRDGDGYIDGTCNFYTLVQLKNGAYALLYIDEQSYFTQRWRLVDPGDHKGLGFALTAGLDDDLKHGSPLYHWRPETFWSPFAAGHVGPNSRLAVSRQVLLITGQDPQTKAAAIYSINFSFSTMDRTWRWRPLPPGAAAEFFKDDAAAGAEQIPAGGPPCVYPQTVRLREDMTVHLKGRGPSADGGSAVGRWYQRYRPATNRPGPAPEQLVAGARPPQGYSHPWRFLPEAVFRSADRFSHFGVYDLVDSRTQYYVVEPAGDGDARALASAGEGPWVDADFQLSVGQWKFWWAAPLRFPDLPAPAQRPPSLFNPQTLLRVVRRGAAWVAMHWDKRDDDLMPFDGLPVTLTLSNGAARARVTLRSNVWVEGPPMVLSAALAWTADPRAPVALTFTVPMPFNPLPFWFPPSGPVQANVWRVRLAALDPLDAPPDPAHPNRPGGVVALLDVAGEGHFNPTGPNTYEYRWAPTAGAEAMLRRYCSSAGAAAHGTSVWFEDAVGHVSVPEEVRWLPRLCATAVEPAVAWVGEPAAITVHAVDLATGAAVAAPVWIDGRQVGVAGTAFTYTFHSRQASVRAVAPGLGEAPVPLEIRQGALAVSVEPRLVPLGRPVSLTVHAVDDHTKQAAAGATVTIHNYDALGKEVDLHFPANAAAPSPVTFRRAHQVRGPHNLPPEPGALPQGTVSAPGYADAAVPFPWGGAEE